MEAHPTYFTFLFHDGEIEKFFGALLLGAGLILAAKFLKRSLQSPSDQEAAIIPSEKLSLRGIFDLAIENFVQYHDSILGKENRHHIPFTGSIFLFVLLSNLIGLVPGFPAITTTVWVNVAMALCVFVYFNQQGIKAHGLLGYLKHFMGPLLVLSPLILPLEILSTLMRILTLNLRLYWNMTADHMVLSTFTDLVPFGLPVVFYALGTFVCIMQAFVFTTLTMIYILLATQHDEEEGHSH